MKNLFMLICSQISVSGNCEAAFSKITEQYQIPERFYHTFTGHIAFCIQELRNVPAPLLFDKNAVAMALFLHDVIMNFHASDNEKKSAEFARELFSQIGAPEKFGKKVAELILATKHDVIAKNCDARIVADIDLAILGQDCQTFDEYEKNVRKEYSFVPEDIFKKERAKLLRHFLNRPSIFSTHYFQRRYGKKARQNLERSIAQLER